MIFALGWLNISLTPSYVMVPEFDVIPSQNLKVTQAVSLPQSCSEENFQSITEANPDVFKVNELLHKV